MYYNVWAGEDARELSAIPTQTQFHLNTSAFWSEVDFQPTSFLKRQCL